MAKYSFVFKKQIVLEYLSGGGGSDFLAKKYGVPQGRLVRSWIKNYNELGEDGLRRSREKKNYSFEFKLSMVESYLSSEFSYQELALRNGISNSALVAKWVNDFRAAGPDALRPHKKGRKKTLDKPQKNTNVQPCEETVVNLSAFILNLIFPTSYVDVIASSLGQSFKLKSVSCVLGSLSDNISPPQFFTKLS